MKNTVATYFEKIILVTGHYGCGKTNLAVNLARDIKLAGNQVVLVDLDIVNPYFRTADFRTDAKAWGIELYAPPFANSNVDLPVLTAELDAILGGAKHIVIDVGGDDAGAFALGGYASRIRQLPYTMLYVINQCRYLTRHPQEAAALMKQIEQVSRLDVTHLVNNSNVAYLTGLEDVRAGMEYADLVSQLTGKPIALTAVKKELVGEIKNVETLYPVNIYVKAPWDLGQ